MATADPATLMRLSSGGLGSAVIGEGGKIVSHAGFQSFGGDLLSLLSLR